MQKFLCCSLRTGILTIGITSIVLSCLHMIGYLHFMANFEILAEALAKTLPDCDPDNSSAAANCNYIAWFILCALAVMCCFRLLLDSLLIHGVLKERPGLMTPYLIEKGLNIAFLSAMVILGIFLMFYPEPSSTIGYHISVVSLLGAFICAYIFTAVKSYRIQLLQKQAMVPTRLLEDQDLPPPYPDC